MTTKPKALYTLQADLKQDEVFKMTQSILTEGLEGILREAEGNESVIGIRVFTQYCLTEDPKPIGNGDGNRYLVAPTIICHLLGDQGVVHREHTESFTPYDPLEAMNPEKIGKISRCVSEKALEIARRAREAGLRTIVYNQGPPYFLVLNGQYQGDKSKQ